MRYKIWDRVENICTQGKDPTTKKMEWTPEEYIMENARWAKNPGVKIVVGGEDINGTVFASFNMFVKHYERLGLEIEPGMTDAEVLAAIEEFEDRPPPVVISPEERIAASLEFANLLNM